MQRASRSFRGGGGRSRHSKSAMAVDLGDVYSPWSVASKGSDADSAVSFDEQQISDDVVVHVAKQDRVEEERLEIVQEKITTK